MAIGKKNKSAVSSQEWVVEFYPFSSPDPTDDSASESSVSVGAVTSSGVSKASVLDTLKNTGVYKSGSSDDSSLSIQSGLIRLSFSKSKKTPEDQCQLTFVGKPRVPVVVGTWVVVSSIFNKSGEENQLVRFIGQIHTAETEYSTQPNGLVSQVTTIGVRSWSSMLTMPVRYDMFAIAKQTSADFGSLAASLQATVGNSFDIESLSAVVAENYNAFEFAHLILKLVGCLNASDAIDKIENLGVEGFPQIALTMPSVPKKLLDRIGLSGVDPRNPFQPKTGPGLVKVITGILTGAFNSTGSWNGIFDKGSGITIDKFDSLHNKNPQVRPTAAGGGGILGFGEMSAWELLNQYSDPSLHEVITDILYERLDTKKSTVVAKPVIFVRDKPFLLKKILNSPDRFGLTSKQADLVGKNWSLFDDVPRVRLSDAHISSLRIRNTLYNSPNLIRFNFSSPAGAAGMERTLSSLNPVRLTNHMHRWGGQEHFIQTQFYPTSILQVADKPPVSMEEWSEAVKGVCSAWHSYNYRMGDATLTMRDDGAALTVGFNAQFSFGDNELVGHIEDVRVNFAVLPNGVEETVTSIALSRVVMVNKDTGDLDFLPMDGFGKLQDQLASQSENGLFPVVKTASKSVTDLSAVGSIKSIFGD